MGVRVGVIDSGWNRSLTDTRVLKGVGFVDPDDDLASLHSDDDQDRNGHGTACTRLILRVADDARIIPIRVFGKRIETSVATVIAALQWATQQRIDLVNLSLATVRQDAVRPLYAACEQAQRNGVIIVAANANARRWSYPAVFENTIGVEAEECDEPLAFRYRRGAAIECAANGLHPDSGSRGGRESGRTSSMAAPIVSGTVAKLLERHPNAGLPEVRRLLEESA